MRKFLALFLLPMAALGQIRPNAEPTTTQTYTDDYFNVDGTTFGTRKMSAYSPIFGGSLQVNGTNFSVGGAPLQTGATNNLNIVAPSGNGALYIGQDATHGISAAWEYNATAGSAYGLFGTYGSNNPLTIQGSSVSVTASGNTVLAMGPSQAATFYGQLNLSIPGSSTVNDLNLLQPSLANGNLVEINLGSAISSNNDGVLGFVQNATASYLGFWIYGDTIGSDLNILKGGQVQAAAAIASTSTSTGALVVPNGGVGINGALNVGGDANIHGWSISGGSYPSLSSPNGTTLDDNSSSHVAGLATSYALYISSGGGYPQIYIQPGGTTACLFSSNYTYFYGEFGFVTGQGLGGTVTQTTSRSTGVTLNKLCGQITGNNSSLAAATAVSFTVTDSSVSATSTVQLNLASGGSATTFCSVTAVASGSFRVTEYNSSGSADTTTPVMNFAVIAGSTN